MHGDASHDTLNGSGTHFGASPLTCISRCRCRSRSVWVYPYNVTYRSWCWFWIAQPPLVLVFCARLQIWEIMFKDYMVKYSEIQIFQRKNWFSTLSIPKDGSDIHRFSNRKLVSAMCNVGNLWISEASLSKLEKFQRSSAHPDIKYNCAVLFWSQLCWVFIYDSKYIFS